MENLGPHLLGFVHRYRLPHLVDFEAIGRRIRAHAEQVVMELTSPLANNNRPPPLEPVAVPPRPQECGASGGSVSCRTADSALNGQRTVPQARHQDPAKERMQRDDVYSMVHSPRGLCIIINNFNFRGSGQQRDGSKHDERNMESLFTALHFRCIVGTNMTASEMKDLLYKGAWSAHDRTDCLVVILMSHGTKDTIHGVDNVPLHLDDDVYAMFNSANCPNLQGKPKVFFIQACRGEKEDNPTGTTAYESADAMAMAAEVPQTSTRERMATWSDMYIAYATIPGYKALINRVIGSWFFLAVYKVFTDHAGTMHLEELMHHVQKEVMSLSSSNGTKQTPGVEMRGWRKKLYFNPGFFTDYQP
uniref:Caspase9 n=1 Tax=Rhipicephalus haemaphysaloides TaxID=237073 RepID=A0A7T7JNU1_RHIHE|nr:caspase9 [Rhipicephalus haemaphysaloides]